MAFVSAKNGTSIPRRSAFSEVMGEDRLCEKIIEVTTNSYFLVF